MNKKFEGFIDEIKRQLLVYEMDESSFSECYDDNDRQIMRRLREALYPSKQQVYLFKDSEEYKKSNIPTISMTGGSYRRKEKSI